MDINKEAQYLIRLRLLVIFPADNPLYSCIVVVNAPSNSVYYGNLVAGPVFKEISDKVYATTFFKDIRDVKNTDENENNIVFGSRCRQWEQR